MFNKMFRNIRLFRYGLKRYSTFQPPNNLRSLRNEIECVEQNLRDEIECMKQNLRRQVNGVGQNLREVNKSMGQDLRKEIDQSLREIMKKEFQSTKNELKFQNLKNELKLIKAETKAFGMIFLCEYLTVNVYCYINLLL